MDLPIVNEQKMNMKSCLVNAWSQIANGIAKKVAKNARERNISEAKSVINVNFE